MSKRFAFTLVMVFMLQAMWIGVVSADTGYNSDNDITLSVTVAEDYLQTSDSTGEATFEAQEEAHQMFNDNSGEEVEHFYIWVEINGSKVLAVDPPCPMMN
jgi:hypothetical protein